eukprot:Pgem_evm1s19122
MSKIYTEFMQQLLDSVTEGMTKLIDMNEKCTMSEAVSFPPELLPGSKTLQTTMMDVVNYMREQIDGRDATYDKEVV